MTEKIHYKKLSGLSSKINKCFGNETDGLVEYIVIGGETWVSYTNVELKQQ